MHNMDSNHKDTENCLNLQIAPGVRVGILSLQTKPNPIQVDCYDREVVSILLFPFRMICPAPMILVHGFEYSPLRIVFQSFMCCRSIEAILQRRKICFSGKLIVSLVSSQCSVSTPVAHHDSIVAESKFIEPVNDDLCTSRQKVWFFACYHNCLGIKLNIDNDGVSTILFPIQQTSIIMSKFLLIDNCLYRQEFSQRIVVAKCQLPSCNEALITPRKMLSNHVANHDSDFIISVISIHYKGLSDDANHVSNHDVSKMSHFYPHLTTQATTITGIVICVIPIPYGREFFDANHVANHDSPKIGGSKMKATTQVTTRYVYIMTYISIDYSGVILLANHVSNHGATLKMLPKKTYGSIIYIIILNIIIFYLQGEVRVREREHTHAHTREWQF